MAGPWEKYQTAQAAPKPWEKFGGAAEQEPGMLEQLKSGAQDVLAHPVTQGALTALDYAGGIARTAAATPFEFAQATMSARAGGDEDLSDIGQSWKKALKGEALSSSELMENLGVGEGPEVAGISARDVVGFIGDVLTDPLTYFTGGASALGKAGKLSKLGKTKKAASDILNLGRPGSRATQWLGKKSYQSAYKDLDRAVSKAGKGEITPKLLEEKAIKGSYKNVYNKIDTLKKSVGKKVDSAVKQVDASGVQGVINLSKSREMAMHGLRDKSLTKSQFRKIMREMDGISGPITPVQMNRYKKTYGKKAKSAWKDMAASPESAKIYKQMNMDAMKGVDDLAKQVDPNLAKTIKEGNAYYSQLIPATKAAAKQAGKAAGRGATLDMLVGGATGFAYGWDPKAMAAAVLARRAITHPKTALKSKLGKAMYNLGTKTRATDRAGIRALINLGDMYEQDTE